MGRRPNYKRDAALRELHSLGATFEEAVSAVRLKHRQHLNQIEERLGLRFPRASQIALMERVRKIRELWEGGYGGAEIAKMLGLEAAVVYRISHKFGIPLAQNLPDRFCRAASTDPVEHLSATVPSDWDYLATRRAAVEKCAREGMGLHETCQALNLPVGAVHQYRFDMRRQERRQ